MGFTENWNPEPVKEGDYTVAIDAPPNARWAKSAIACPLCRESLQVLLEPHLFGVSRVAHVHGDKPAADGTWRYRSTPIDVATHDVLGCKPCGIRFTAPRDCEAMA